MSDDLYHVDLMTVEASTLFILHLLYIPSLRATLKEATQRLPGPKGKRGMYCRDKGDQKPSLQMLHNVGDKKEGQRST